MSFYGLENEVKQQQKNILTHKLLLHYYLLHQLTETKQDNNRSGTNKQT